MQTVERIVAASSNSPNEDNVDRALRPERLADYVGQPAVREQLEVFMEGPVL